MDNLWIYIFIIGIALSFAQKNKRKRVEQEGDSPEVDPRQEWERQIRELLGEPKQAESQPAEQTMPSQQSATPKNIVLPSKNAKLSNSNHATTKGKASYKTTAKAADKTVAVTTASEDAPNENIEKIIDDFSMEKAVIYAEILKPKYEEY